MSLFRVQNIKTGEVLLTDKKKVCKKYCKKLNSENHGRIFSFSQVSGNSVTTYHLDAVGQNHFKKTHVPKENKIKLKVQQYLGKFK